LLDLPVHHHDNDDDEYHHNHDYREHHCNCAIGGCRSRFFINELWQTKSSLQRRNTKLSYRRASAPRATSVEILSIAANLYKI